MIERAKENIKRAGFENKLTILEGDAEELLPKVEGKFDMIFLDAAKGQYKLFYDFHRINIKLFNSPPAHFFDFHKPFPT